MKKRSSLASELANEKVLLVSNDELEQRFPDKKDHLRKRKSTYALNGSLMVVEQVAFDEFKRITNAE